MNNENNNNSQEILKVSNWDDIPKNYSGIVEYFDGTKYCFLNGEFHRTDGPAVEWSDGSKLWYLNGNLHRTDGPARVWPNGDKFWFLNGKPHRTDGPAIEFANGSKQWWLNGIQVNPLFFEIPGCEKYVDYYMTILQTELREHEDFLLKELKKQIESGINKK